jgi:hypothetical protein
MRKFPPGCAVRKGYPQENRKRGRFLISWRTEGSLLVFDGSRRSHGAKVNNGGSQISTAEMDGGYCASSSRVSGYSSLSFGHVASAALGVVSRTREIDMTFYNGETKRSLRSR